MNYYNRNDRNRTSYAMPRLGNTYSNDLELALRAFETTALNFGQRFIQDGGVRADYQRQIKSVSKNFMFAVSSGQMTPSVAAKEVSEIRNSIMSAARKNSSDIGRAMAEGMKKNGLTFDSLLEKYAQQLSKKPFAELTQSQKGDVYRKIVESGGKGRNSVNSAGRIVTRFGRALLVVSFGIAAYNIVVAEDKIHAAGKEGATLTGGFAGGAAMGAAAGMVCGPGAPVCVTLGVFIGGLLGAYSGDLLFEWASN